MPASSVGDASDGLVRIRNATTRSKNTNGDGYTYSPHAFVHRSHSGFFGIVNSEEGYQNLIRFLFGDVRADMIIVTKLDEAAHVGVVLNVIRKTNKTLSYITTG